MSPWLAVLVAAVSVALVQVVARAGARWGPAWMLPARGPLWAVAAVLLASASALGSALGLPWLAYLSPRLEIAEAGAAGAVAAFALSLGALLVTTALLHLASARQDGARAPGRAAARLFGIAADGSALEGVRRPLRWGVHGLALALIVGLPFSADRLEPTAWALALMVLVALGRSLAPAPRDTLQAAPAIVAEPSRADAHAGFHRALGSPPLFEREPAVAVGDDDYASEIVAACSSAAEGASPWLVAVAAPDGAGKRRAAQIVAERFAARGLATLWIQDDESTQSGQGESGEKVAVQSMSPSELSVALARGTAFPRLGLVVVDAAVALSGEVLASLRYGMHRLSARERVVPGALVMLVIGTRPSVVTVARAIGAAEPKLVLPKQPLPTQPILRYLLDALPDPRLAAAPPEDTRFVALDRPAPLRRYASARTVAREYLVPVGGPLGRRMREDRAQSLVRGRASRLLVALPGDREAPERRDGLARFHLRAALAEAPQDVERLRAVFSPGLVDREVAALERAGLVSHLHGWSPAATGLVAAPRISARLPRSGSDHAGEAGPTAFLVEPRSARKREVTVQGIDLEYFDGAITTLDAGPTAARFEVRHGFTRVLVPTTLVSATPLRTLTTELVAAPRKTRLRFRGTREIEVWEGAIDVHALHRGVRQFAAVTAGELRAYTRLLPEPVPLPPLRTAARMLIFGADAAPSPAALHAMVHALREVLPCFFDNAADLGVTYATGDESGGHGQPLWAFCWRPWAAPWAFCWRPMGVPRSCSSMPIPRASARPPICTTTISRRCSSLHVSCSNATARRTAPGAASRRAAATRRWLSIAARPRGSWRRSSCPGRFRSVRWARARRRPRSGGPDERARSAARERARACARPCNRPRKRPRVRPCGRPAPPVRRA